MKLANNKRIFTIEELLIIIVCYKQKIEESTAYKTVMHSATICGNAEPCLFIYDNSPNDFQQNSINSKKQYYIRNLANPGISQAYNEGALFARETNKNWLLFLDHDTSLPENFFQILRESIDLFPEQVLFAPRLIERNLQLSPCGYLFAKGFPYKNRTPSGIYEIKGKNLLNSGLCIRLDAFLKSKGYPNRVKLYYSDFVFINRFRKEYSTFFLMDINIQHRMSALMDNVDKQIETFKLFCRGAREAAIEQPKYWFYYFINTLLRSCILRLRYKKSVFVSIFFNYFLKK